jgi:hypothetical protein
MASILRVNTLTDASSGNSTPMATINQGTAKAWANFTGTGTATIDDSFNIGSLTDNASGNYTFAYSNAFSSGNHSTTMGVGQTTIGARRDAPESASTVNVSCMNPSFINEDEPSAYFTCHGDLA